MASATASLLLFLMVTLSHSHQADQQLIYVGSNQTGANDSSCWEGGYSTPCLSLNLALKGAQHYNHSITILLQPGQHQLHNGSETQLRNVSQVSIVGNGSEGEVVITCQPLAGLAFFWSTNIAISNLSLIGCGTFQHNTNTNSSLIQIVALLFSSCSLINLSNLRVSKSGGTGVIIYNPMGNVFIDESSFSHNGLYGSVGGGLVIEVSEASSHLFCTINNSNFTHNTASSAAGQWIRPSVNGARGGGISVVLRGKATNNTIQLSSVLLSNNQAQFGGGLFLGFYDNASNTTVTVDKAEMKENMLQGSSASGGGIFVAMEIDYLMDNVVAIKSSRFISNEANIGGGISVNIVQKAYGCPQMTSNELLIQNCNFVENIAFQGSSAYLSQSGQCIQPILNTTIDNSNFTKGHCGTKLGLKCFGSFLAETMPHVKFQGLILFIGAEHIQTCYLSALSLHSSSIELLPTAKLQFINNSALNGAGIYLMGSSSITVNNGSAVLFKHNTALDHGAAIYVDTCTQRFCFVKHSDPALHPDDWGVNITFIDNKLLPNSSNAIYVDSVKLLNTPDSFTNQTFCWKGWYYQNECFHELRSGPASVNFTGSLNITIYPGDWLYDKFELKVYDIWGMDITDKEKIFLEFVNGSAYTSTFYGRTTTLESTIEVDCSTDYTNQSSHFFIHPFQFPVIAITIHFKYCDPLHCQYCDGKICARSHCHSSGSNGFCPSSYMNTSSQTTCVSNREGLLCGKCSEDHAIAINDPDFNCIKCKPPYYGIAIFLFLQIILVFIMLVLLAILDIKIINGAFSGYVFFSQMVTLQFPGLGYSSLMPTCIDNSIIVNHYRQFIFGIPLIVYDIWNLNFLNLVPVPFCIFNTDAAMVIFLQYITAACPLVFIAVTYTWIKWYSNGYRLVVYTTRPIHQLLARFWQKFKIQPSLIDTYGGLMLLSHMCFLTTSVKLLKYTFIFDDDSKHINTSFYYDANMLYFGESHALYGSVAIICLLVFVVTPMITILFYHLASFQQCLAKCRLNRPGLHALVDAFQGCFKNSATDGSERRYFAGFYLLLRFLYVGSFLYHDVAFSMIIGPILFFIMAAMIIILRPYKRIVHNFINFMVVFFLLMYSIAGFVFMLFQALSFIGLFSSFIPFLVLCFYLTYRLFKQCSCNMNCKKKTLKDSDELQPPFAVPAPTYSTVAIDDPKYGSYTVQ